MRELMWVWAPDDRPRLARRGHCPGASAVRVGHRLWASAALVGGPLRPLLGSVGVKGPFACQSHRPCGPRDL